MTSPGQKVVDVAMSTLGERETSPNRSPFIDMVNARFGLRGTPWCGAWWAWCYFRAGVSDSGIGSPSTQVMCDRARSIDAIWTPGRPVPAGAAWVACGIHVGMVIHDRGDGTLDTCEGNHNNAVSLGRRAISDGLVIVPIAILGPAEPPPVTSYWLEDTHAEPRLFGPWKERIARARALAKIPAERRARVRLVHDRRGYGWLEGPRRMYGPWLDKSARDAAAPIISRRVGHDLRPFSRPH